MKKFTAKSDKHLAILDYILKFETKYSKSQINVKAFNRFFNSILLATDQQIDRFDITRLTPTQIDTCFNGAKNAIKRDKLIFRLERDYIIRLNNHSYAPEFNKLELFKKTISTANFLKANPNTDISADITFDCSGISNLDLAIKAYATSEIKRKL